MPPQEQQTQGTTAENPSQGGPASSDGDANANQSTQQGAADAGTSPEQQQQKPAEGSPQIPEAYKFEMPEGVTPWDDARVAVVSSIAKDLGLSQEKAQAFFATLVTEGERLKTEQIKTIRDQFASMTREDKELGGDKLDENLGIAKTALTRFGTPQLVQLLEETGLGQHPEVVRLLHKVGTSISEDKVHEGSRSTSGAGDRDPAKVLFPTMQ